MADITTRFFSTAEKEFWWTTVTDQEKVHILKKYTHIQLIPTEYRLDQSGSLVL